MASVGDNISELSSKEPFASGSPWISDTVILGQYNSLTVTVKCDADTTLTAAWSADGFHFDYVEEYNIPASSGVSGKKEFLVVGNKWIRLSLSTSGSPTYTRISTYGVVTNNNSQSILVPQAGGKLSSINIANFPNAAPGAGILTSSPQPFRTYSFRGWTAGNSVDYTSSDSDMRVYNLGSASDVVQPFTNGFNTQSFGTGSIGNGVCAYDLYHTALPMGVLATLQWTCQLRYLGGNNLTTMTAGAGFGTFSSSDHMFARDGIFITNGPGGVRISYVVAGVVTTYDQASWNVDTFTGVSNQVSSMVLDVSVVNSYRVDVLRDVCVTVYILDTVRGKFLPAHIININGTTVLPWENPSLGFMNVIRQDTAIIPTSTTKVFCYNACLSFTKLGKALPIRTVTASSPSGLILGQSTSETTYVDIRNNNALSTQAYVSALLRVKSITASSFGGSSGGIVEITGYLNANPSGGSYTVSSAKTCTQVNNTVTTITPDDNTKVPLTLTTLCDRRGTKVDMIPYNIWVRTPENLTIAFKYTAPPDGPASITYFYTIVLEEYR